MMMKALYRQATRLGLKSLDLSSSLGARRFYESQGFALKEACSLALGGGQRLDYYEMVKPPHFSRRHRRPKTHRA
jgi:hypothetical protein